MNKPNILLITTDQQRFDTIGALGNQHIYTPHLNWLVDEGIAFTRCYSDCPVCMPARATIMTGKAGYQHGLVGNDYDYMPMKHHTTFPELLTKEGYQTRAEGKLHFSPMRTGYGIEHAELPMDYFNEMRKWNCASTRTHGLGENEMEPAINTIPERDTLTHWIVDRSINFIETRDETRPFFLWTSFTKPHPPFDPCLPYWELYRDAPLPAPLTDDWSGCLLQEGSGYYAPTHNLNRLDRLSPFQLLQGKRAYYACITQIDYNLGLLFARMRELNLLENTWIIFTSDHGEMLGDHHMGAKSVFFEGSAHIPLLIKPPAAFGHSHPEYAGLLYDEIVTLKDLMPTILNLASIQADVNGSDLLQLLHNPVKQIFYGNCEHRYFSVIKNEYKYLWTIYGGLELLFNLNLDPDEQRNLASLPEFQTVKQELKEIMIEKMQSSSPQLLKNGTPICADGQHPNAHTRFPGFNTTLFPRDSFH